MRAFVCLSLSAVVCATGALSQTPDTTQVRELVQFEAKIDSLWREMRSMDGELQRLKLDVAQGMDLERFLAALEEEAPEDQRSRRKRVDALLKIMTDRPGQLRLNGGATTTIQGTRTGDDSYSTGVGSFDIYAHAAFGPNTLLFLDFEAIGGNGPNERITTFSSLNADGGSTQGPDGIDRVNVLEAWAEFKVWDERITITSGKIDLTNYFDNNASANDETSQFISAAFVNSTALPVPSNSPGARLRTVLLGRFYMQLGICSADNSGNNLFRDLFKIGGTGFKILPDSKWEANLRIYGYLHPYAEDNGGVGFSFDESISGSFNIFARYNRNEERLAEWFGLESAWSAGARFLTMPMGRRTAVGIAYGETTPSGEELERERISELYMRTYLNRWVHVSPHVIFVWNAGGSSEELTIVGVRTHFNF